MPRCTARLLAPLCAILLAPVSLAADEGPLRHWSAGRQQALRSLEAAILAGPSTDRLAATHERLARDPHMAGTPGGMAVAEAIASEFESLGLEVERHEVEVLLPWFIGAEVDIIAPERISLPLRERALDEDPLSRRADVPAAFNAWGATGDAAGEVVYANYGRKEDFDRLRELGVDCAGRIVIARYGGNYRGYKAKFAEEAGAAALLIYTDPADSGWGRGVLFPEGTWAHPSSIQRGSLLTLPYRGDPLTPFVESNGGAERLDPATVALPKIPVQPLSWEAAEQVLSRMKGAGVPRGWQGGLPFAYRLTGGDDLRVRVRVEQDRRPTRVMNVVGTLRGASIPDERILIGAHHDAWGFGADDPLSGTIVVVEAARALAEAAQAGHRPARSISFCAWDAEEFGIIGSVEWVEANRAMLTSGAIAYFNLDAAVSGFSFGSAASASLAQAIADACASVAAPRGEGVVLDQWRESSGVGAADLPSVGTLGGGSDHVGFLCHLGIASAAVGMSGEPGVAYHSAFDHIDWYRKMMGGSYEPHAALAGVVALAAARIADADLLPNDPGATLRAAAAWLDELAPRAVSAGLEGDIAAPAARARAIADRSDEIRARALDALADGSLSPAALSTLNRATLLADRAWLDPEGLPDRPWYRSVLVAPDEDSGYASWPAPGVRRAIERKDGASLDAALSAFDAALSRVDRVLDVQEAALSAAR